MGMNWAHWVAPLGSVISENNPSLWGRGKKSTARSEEELRQERIKEGMTSIDKNFSMFTPEFYKDRQNAYTNYAMPQLLRQANQTGRQQYFGLANRGLQNSSAMQTGLSNLGREVDLQKQAVVDTGAQQAQELQKQVEAQRGNLISQLQVSGDPTIAAQQALATAGAYSMPSTFASLTNMFSSFASLYGNRQLANAYNPTNYKPNYGISSPMANNASVVKKN